MIKQRASNRNTKIRKVRLDRAALAGLRAAREILLLCTTANVSPIGKKQLSQILTEPVNWRYLLDLAEFQGIIPLVAHNLVGNGFSHQVPQSYIDQLKHDYNRIMSKNLILSSELTKVLSTLSQVQIAAIPLKGTVLAEVLYGNPGLRMVVDMDIWVHSGEISLAGTVLSKLGYKQEGTEQAWQHPFHSAPYRKEGHFPVFLDLHWALDDSREVAFPQQEIWRRAQPLQLQGVPILTLSPEDNLMFMANHLSKNDFHRLKFLGDIAELLKKYQGSLDWDYITKSAHSWQIASAVYYALVRAKDLIGAPVPASSLEALRPSSWRWWLLDFLVSQETFVSPIKWNRLRSETLVLTRSLMVSGPHRMLAVLSRHRGPGKKGAWLRTLFWIMLVFVAGWQRYWKKLAARGTPGLVKHGYS
jgi:hypothetical protein